jgi:hypothetical protein
MVNRRTSRVRLDFAEQRRRPERVGLQRQDSTAPAAPAVATADTGERHPRIVWQRLRFAPLAVFALPPPLCLPLAFLASTAFPEPPQVIRTAEATGDHCGRKPAFLTTKPRPLPRVRAAAPLAFLFGQRGRPCRRQQLRAGRRSLQPLPFGNSPRVTTKPIGQIRRDDFRAALVGRRPPFAPAPLRTKPTRVNKPSVRSAAGAVATEPAAALFANP